MIIDASLVLGCAWLIAGTWSLWQYVIGTNPGLGALPDFFLIVAVLFYALAIGCLIGRRFPLPAAVESKLEAIVERHETAATVVFWVTLLGTGLWTMSSRIGLAAFGAWAFAFAYGISSEGEAATRVKEQRATV